LLSIGKVLFGPEKDLLPLCTIVLFPSMGRKNLKGGPD
jgi:hypothetical protein